MAHSAAGTTVVKEGNQGPTPANDKATSPYANPKQFPDMIEMLELVGTNPSQRNWRGILIALLVILIVLSLIVVAVILVTPKEEDAFLGEPFSLDDMFNPAFKPRDFKGHWVGNKNIYVYRSREGEIMEYNADLNATSIIMDNSTFRELNTDVYYVSDDLQYVLIAYDIEPVFRHSFKARYKIYNRKAKHVKERLIPFPQGSGGAWANDKLQYAGWSASGSRLAFVYDNNLFYQADPITTPNVVTVNTEKDIYNGLPDWLYEEEILHTNKAHWWSPQGAFLAYARFDDTLVPKYRYPYYGKSSDIYGNIEELSYPKAGDRGSDVNPKVRLFLTETSNTRIAHKELLPPPEFEGQEFYLKNVVWQDENSILVAWLNRPQNMSIVRLCHAMSSECHNNLVETTKGGNGWINFPEPRFIEGGQSYLTILPNRDGNHGYWKHIAMVTAPSGMERGRKSFVTQGPFDVHKLVGFDEKESVAYFLTNERAHPRVRHLYAVGISENVATLLEPSCLTCGLPKECQYLSATFTVSGEYYILGCLGPGVPAYYLRSTRDNRVIPVEDNADVQARLAKKALPTVEYMEIEDPTKTYTIWVKVLLPRTLDKNQVIKYPVLVHTYSAPETQKVTEEFHLGWETVLVSAYRVVCVMIDGRGTLARGDHWLHQVYRQLGVKEVQDQIIATKYLRDNASQMYIDPKRIAIWGWSYGGFVTSHVIGDPSDVFTCGIAVAPVTDWRYYDTAYTERYMGLSSLEENFRGYDNSNVSRKAANFIGKNFMLVHGTADDNVHFQHTAQLLKALTYYEVDYRVQVYADKNHAIAGPKTSRHLYLLMTRYLRQTCWDGGQPLDPSKPQTGSTDEVESS